MKENKLTEYFECECFGLDHIIKFTIFEWTKDNYELILFTHLNNYLSFWKRLLHGFKYVCRFPYTFGGFSETIIELEDIPRLRSVLDEFEKLNRKEINE